MRMWIWCILRSWEPHMVEGPGGGLHSLTFPTQGQTMIHLMIYQKSSHYRFSCFGYKLKTMSRYLKIFHQMLQGADVAPQCDSSHLHYICFPSNKCCKSRRCCAAAESARAVWWWSGWSDAAGNLLLAARSLRQSRARASGSTNPGLPYQGPITGW